MGHPSGSSKTGVFRGRRRAFFASHRRWPFGQVEGSIARLFLLSPPRLSYVVVAAFALHAGAACVAAPLITPTIPLPPSSSGALTTGGSAAFGLELEPQLGSAPVVSGTGGIAASTQLARGLEVAGGVAGFFGVKLPTPREGARGVCGAINARWWLGGDDGDEVRLGVDATIAGGAVLVGSGPTPTTFAVVQPELRALLAWRVTPGFWLTTRPGLFAFTDFGHTPVPGWMLPLGLAVDVDGGGVFAAEVGAHSYLYIPSMVYAGASWTWRW